MGVDPVLDNLQLGSGCVEVGHPGHVGWVYAREVVVNVTARESGGCLVTASYIAAHAYQCM